MGFAVADEKQQVLTLVPFVCGQYQVLSPYVGCQYLRMVGSTDKGLVLSS